MTAPAAITAAPAGAAATHPAAGRLDVDYCRISIDKGGQEIGVNAQHREIVEFSTEQERTIAATYSDNDISAFDESKERPGLARLLADVAANRIRSITVFEAKRLYRRVVPAQGFIDLCRAHNVRVFSMSKGTEYNFKRATGRNEFLSDILKGQEESDVRGDRVSVARKTQALNGDWGGGVRAYGWGELTYEPTYRDDKRRGRVMKEPHSLDANGRPLWLDMTKHNPAEAKEIRRWKSDLLSGNKRRGMAHVLRDMAARNVPTVSETDGRTLKRSGKDVVHSGWNSKTVRQILTNPRVAGHAVYDGEIVKRNAFDPIITEDERQALVALFADPTRKTSPGNTPKWLGSLIYECSICRDGSIMRTRYTRKTKSKRTGEIRGGVPVYVCESKGHAMRPAVETDNYVAQAVIALLARDDVMELMPQRATVDVAALRDELRTLDAREVDTAVKAARGAISDAMMEVFSAEIEKRRQEIYAELDDATGESPLSPFAAVDNIEAAARIWDGLSLGRRREILRLVFRVEIMPCPVRGYRGPFIGKDAVKLSPPRRVKPVPPAARRRQQIADAA